MAEREGIGVDRMVREMVRLGHRPPEIREIPGPFVRVSLVGDAIDEAWIAWLGQIVPREETQDVNSLLLLRRLVEEGWVDAIRAATVIQLTVEEARGAISKLARARIASAPVVVGVDGVPEGTEPVFRLHVDALDSLSGRDRSPGTTRRLPSRSEVARTYAAARGRISTTELASLVNASSTNVGGVLKSLEQEGVLAPSSETRRGRGFYYRWVVDQQSSTRASGERSDEDIQDTGQ